MGIIEYKDKVPFLNDKLGERDQKAVNKARKTAKQQSEKQANSRQKRNEAQMAKEEKERG